MEDRKASMSRIGDQLVLNQRVVREGGVVSGRQTCLVSSLTSTVWPTIAAAFIASRIGERKRFD